MIGHPRSLRIVIRLFSLFVSQRCRISNGSHNRECGNVALQGRHMAWNMYSVSVGSLSDLHRHTVRTESVVLTTRKIQIGSKSDWERHNRDEFGWKRVNRDASWTVSDCYRIAVLIKKRCFNHFWISTHEPQDFDTTFDKFISGMVLSRSAVKIGNVYYQLKSVTKLESQLLIFINWLRGLAELTAQRSTNAAVIAP